MSRCLAGIFASTDRWKRGPRWAVGPSWSSPFLSFLVSRTAVRHEAVNADRFPSRRLSRGLSFSGGRLTIRCLFSRKHARDIADTSLDIRGERQNERRDRARTDFPRKWKARDAFQATPFSDALSYFRFVILRRGEWTSSICSQLGNTLRIWALDYPERDSSGVISRRSAVLIRRLWNGWWRKTFIVISDILMAILHILVFECDYLGSFEWFIDPKTRIVR